MGILPGLDQSVVNALFLDIQGAHLQLSSGRAMAAPQRDELRATLIRQRLSGSHEGS